MSESHTTMADKLHNANKIMKDHKEKAKWLSLSVMSVVCSVLGKLVEVSMLLIWPN